MTSSDDILDKRKAVIKAQSEIEISPDDYEKFTYADPNKRYTRNQIMENEHFTLICLVWNAGKESPIHDHPCDGCWVRVLEGHVRETLYEQDADGQLSVTDDGFYSVGDVTWMHDIKGYHKIGNPTSERAVTLHVYAPPYSVGTMVSLTGEKTSCTVVYDTIGGVKPHLPRKCSDTTCTTVQVPKVVECPPILSETAPPSHNV